jgi:hypothetical protein
LKNLTFFKRYWLVMRQDLQLWTYNKIMKSWMQTFRISKVRTLLFAAELSVTDLFIRNTQSSNVPSDFCMSATVKGAKLWPSKCAKHHDCVCDFLYITIDKAVFGWEQYLLQLQCTHLIWPQETVMVPLKCLCMSQFGLGENIQSNMIPIPILNRLLQMSSSSVSKNNWH